MWDLNLLPTSSAFPSEKAAEHRPKTIDNNKIDNENNDNSGEDIKTVLASNTTIIDSSAINDTSDEIILRKKHVLSNIDLSMTAAFVLPARIANRDVHINGFDTITSQSLLKNQTNLIEKNFPLLHSTLPKFESNVNNLTTEKPLKLTPYLQKEQSLQQKIISDSIFRSSATSATSSSMLPVTSDALYQAVVRLVSINRMSSTSNNYATTSSNNLHSSIKRSSSAMSHLSVLKASKKSMKRTSAINKKMDAVAAWRIASSPPFSLSSLSSETSSSELSSFADSQFSQIASMGSAADVDEENIVVDADNNGALLDDVEEQQKQQKTALNYDNNFDEINEAGDNAMFYGNEDDDGFDDDEFEIFDGADENNIIYADDDSMESSDKDEVWNLQEGNVFNKIRNEILRKQQKEICPNYYLNNKKEIDEQDFPQFPPQKHPRRDFSNYDMFAQTVSRNFTETTPEVELNLLKKRRPPSERFSAKKKKMPSNMDSNIALQAAFTNLSTSLMNSTTATSTIETVSSHENNSTKAISSNYSFLAKNLLWQNKNIVNQEASSSNIKLSLENPSSGTFYLKNKKELLFNKINKFLNKKQNV